MDKIFQIIAVFGLLLLLISRSFRGREQRYQLIGFIKRMRPPLPAEVETRLIAAVVGMPEDLPVAAVEGTVDRFVTNEGLIYCYSAVGRLTIYRLEGERYKQKQELPVPLDCVSMALDPADGKLYFEAGGYIFQFGS